MSLVATCPACGTGFRVRPEQLAAHRGDVRCGKCGHVFNALEHLAEAAPATQQAVPVESGETTGATIGPAPSMEEAGEPDRAPSPQPSPTRGEGAMPVEPEPEPEPIRIVAPVNDVKPLPPFLRPKKSAPLWLTLPLVLILLLAALGQATYFLRTEIAARLPRARPYLVQACALLGCGVELPRRLELLKIDDSELKEDAGHEGVIMLSSTLLNQAGFIQAYPSLVVTLTDADEQPVMRRVFTPQEYLPAGGKPEDGIPAYGEIRVKLLLHIGGASKAAGYNLDLSYP